MVDVSDTIRIDRPVQRRDHVHSAGPDPGVRSDEALLAGDRNDAPEQNRGFLGEPETGPGAAPFEERESRISRVKRDA